MMHIEDCLRSVAELMELNGDEMRYRTYNVTGDSFTPQELETEIQKEIPGFHLDYRPDHRQEIAETWPEVFDDSCARKDWNWRAKYDTAGMAAAMLHDLRPLYEPEHKRIENPPLQNHNPQILLNSKIMI